MNPTPKMTRGKNCWKWKSWGNRWATSALDLKLIRFNALKFNIYSQCFFFLHKYATIDEITKKIVWFFSLSLSHVQFNFHKTHNICRYHGCDGSQAKADWNCWRLVIRRTRAIADTKSNFSIQTTGSLKLSRWFVRTRAHMNARSQLIRPVLYKRIYLLSVSMWCSASLQYSVRLLFVFIFRLKFFSVVRVAWH